MGNMGYNLIKDEGQKEDPSLAILGKTSEDVWPSSAET